MGYHRLGMAFGFGLRKEASVIGKILRKQGFEVVSVICKNGSVPKDRIGIQARINPDKFEVMRKRMIINAGIKKVIIRDTEDEYREILIQEQVKNDESLEGVFGY